LFEAPIRLCFDARRRRWTRGFWNGRQRPRGLVLIIRYVGQWCVEQERFTLVWRKRLIEKQRLKLRRGRGFWRRTLGEQQFRQRRRRWFRRSRRDRRERVQTQLKRRKSALQGFDRLRLQYDPNTEADNQQPFHIRVRPSRKGGKGRRSRTRAQELASTGATRSPTKRVYRRSNRVLKAAL